MQLDVLSLKLMGATYRHGFLILIPFSILAHFNNIFNILILKSSTLNLMTVSARRSGIEGIYEFLLLFFFVKH